MGYAQPQITMKANKALKSAGRIMKIAVAAFLAALMSFQLNVAVFAAAKVSGVVNDDYVNVRDAASLDSNVLFQLSAGDRVTVIDKIGEFYKVTYDGQGGLYINEKYLNVTEANGKVTGDVVNVRSGASTDSEVIGQVWQGEALTITGASGEWYVIRHNGSKGYVKQEFVNGGEAAAKKEEPKKTEPKQETPKQEEVEAAVVPAAAVVIIDEPAGDLTPVADGTEVYGVVTSMTGLNLRESPTQSSAILTTLPTAAAVDLLETGSHWNKVSVDGLVGFMASEYMDIKNGKKPEQEYGGSEGDAVVSYGKRFLGTPYVWAGTNLNTGVDCSGFVYSVYKHFGISLNRSSRDMAANDGYRVSKDSLMPGDLLFFDTNGNGTVSHVGIYIGDGQFIHSSSSRKSYCVTISGLYEDYYVRTYMWARRVL